MRQPIAKPATITSETQFMVTKKDVPKAIPPAIEANATEVVMIHQPKQLFTNLRRCIKNGIAIP